MIPATVVRDPKLPYRTKLLAGIVWALTRRDGYCRASNGRLGELFGVHADTVRKDLAMLATNGHVELVGATRSRRIIPRFPHGLTGTPGHTVRNGETTPGQTVADSGSNDPPQQERVTGRKYPVTPAEIDHVLTYCNEVRDGEGLRALRPMDGHRKKVADRLQHFSVVDLYHAFTSAALNPWVQERPGERLHPNHVLRNDTNTERYVEAFDNGDNGHGSTNLGKVSF